MTKQIKDRETIIAETLVNQKIMRNGSPSFTDPLDMLPKHLRDEVFDDARAIIKALENLEN